MHLIISKWFGRKKCGQKSKTMRQKEIEAKEETVYESVFIHLDTNRSRECSLFLRKSFTLFLVIPSVLLAASFQLR